MLDPKSCDARVNRSAHPAWTAVLAGLPLLVGLSGCIVVDDDDDYYEDDDGGVIIDDDIASVGIDEGATLDADPGYGAGVFIESYGYGEWDIWTTCDTEITGYECQYDVFVSGGGLEFNTDIDLEGNDFIEEDFERVHIGMDTDYDTDGASLYAYDGEPLIIEVWLDGRADGSLVFWVENGEIWQGLPTNPTQFVP
ncbi:MAG: hypothetical protein HOW73_00030 [Polyangiaceae bacterium]|nr:hypothetical protein [Polyangiaceae bacterium]